ERAIQSLDTVQRCALRKALHPRLVELDNVGARSKQLFHLLVYCSGKLHRERLTIGMIAGLRLFRHRKRTRQRNLDLSIRVRPQKPAAPALYRACPARGPGERWRGVGYGAPRFV